MTKNNIDKLIKFYKYKLKHTNYKNDIKERIKILKKYRKQFD